MAGRSIRASLAATTWLLAASVAGCTSGFDSQSVVGSVPIDTSATDASTPTTPVDDTIAPATTADPGEPEDDGCAGITPAALTAAIGTAAFDEFTDVSGPDDTTCLFTQAGDAYAVSVRIEPAGTYEDGAFDGLTMTGKLSVLEKALASKFDADPAIGRAPIGDDEAVIVTGIDSIVVAPGGAGALIVGDPDPRDPATGDTVITVEAGGAVLSTDAAGFVPIVTNVLRLAAPGEP